MVLRLLTSLVLSGVVLVAAVPADAAGLVATPAGARPKSTSDKKSLHPRTATAARPVGEKKNHDDTSTPNRGTVDPIGVVGRGHAVEVRATALRNGETCALRIFYQDAQAKPLRDVVPDSKKRCVFSVTVPDRLGVVGEAKVLLILSKATSGKQTGTARQTFTVS